MKLTLIKELPDNMPVSSDYTAEWLREDLSGNFEIVYRAIYGRLYAFARNFLMDEALAEDTVQESFAALWSRNGSMAGGTLLEPYLFVAVKNACIDHFRKMNVIDRHHRHLITVQAFSSFPFDSTESDNELLVRKVMGELSEMQRKVVEMSVMDGLKYKDIAVALGISEGTVHTHIKRAYKYFKQRFSHMTISVTILIYTLLSHI